MGPRRPVPPAEEGTQASRDPPTVQTPEPLTGERFPRRARLGRGSELTACWDHGRRVRAPHLEVAWRRNDVGRPRVGIVVPRYQFTAPARNRLRRRLREILRRYPLRSLGAVDLIVRAKRPAYGAPFAVLRAELTASAGRIP